MSAFALSASFAGVRVSGAVQQRRGACDAETYIAYGDTGRKKMQTGMGTGR
jgi:hypothetical protein